MKSITQKIISTILVLALVAGCFAAMPLANAASKPVPGNPDWKAEYSKSADKGFPAPTLYDRGNAAGDKIPSNAHSADYPGLYFYWDDKQKDDGVLLVSEWVFDLFKDSYKWTLPNVDKKKAATEITVESGFILTAKNSNNYWGYVITKETGEIIDTVDGVVIYAYAIPKQIQFINPNNGKNDKEDLKNINMVFIDGNYKDAKFEIVKNWFDEEGNPITDRCALDSKLKFKDGYTLGENSVKITNYDTAVNGKKITVTEILPDGFLERDGKASQNIVAKWNVNPTVIFNNQKDWVYIFINKIWLDVDGNKIVDLDRVSELRANFKVDGNDVDYRGNALGPQYVMRVKEGSITVTEEPGLTAGFIIESDAEVTKDVVAGENWIVTFRNQEQKVPFESTVVVKKEVQVDGSTKIFSEWWTNAELGCIGEYLSFELYKVADKDDPITETGFVAYGDVSKLRTYSTIDFGIVTEKGWYAVVEVLTTKGAKIFEQAAPMYIYVGESGYNSDGIKVISGSAYGAIVEAEYGENGQNFALPDVWNNALSTNEKLVYMRELGAKWIWSPTDTGLINTFVYGVEGSEAVFEINIGVSEATPIDFYFACDNVAVVYLNDKLVGWTIVALADNRAILIQDLAELRSRTAQNYFTTFDSDEFDGRWAEGWTHAYYIHLNLVPGENVITIYAANSARTSGTGTDNDGYDTTNNPCGLIFACEVPGEAFINVPKETPEPATVTIIKEWSDNAEIFEGETHDGSVAKFTINGDAYVYGETVEVDAGEITVAELTTHMGVNWRLDKVLVDGVEVAYDINEDGMGYDVFVVVYTVEAGGIYEFVFTNFRDAGDADAHYMNFVSGFDFGVPVTDDGKPWNGHEGFNEDQSITDPTIVDYWNYWVNKYGDGGDGFTALTEIVTNLLSPKAVVWAWDRPLTICPETQVGGEAFTWDIEIEFEIDGTEIISASKLYFLADNAVSIFINDAHVGITYLSWQGDIYLNEANNKDNWLKVHDFSLYAENIAPYLKTGTNTIRIIASNEPVTEDMDWNPCGVLLAFEVYSKD
ncbi:MAG: hypothetical protein FWD52_06045 [Candidatus Bathyarchaeota archaeon]|nr:hypothetical protein [Candidatus Termiticorpusculum sp.]